MSSGYTTTTTTSTPPAMVVEEEDEDHDSSSTGYLQDVLFEFTSKRRRLQLLFDDHQPNYSNNQHFHYWNKVGLIVELVSHITNICFINTVLSVLELEKIDSLNFSMIKFVR